MAYLRISEAAGYLGVSDDSVRRWITNGKLSATTDETGRQVVSGAEVAALAQAAADGRSHVPGELTSSARNKLNGLVTKIVSDKVMSQVELQCGPFRVVSLISTEAVQELDIEVGSPAIATVKATNVVIETTGLSS
ncbi:TOBE domain-containing protein [Enteractinococcus helveticum]|uniref:MerR family transcriptional regulator n=1 Tax=Enteractinococcus helveticum TaxID=1837282 RepID=A0A1B7LW56_9MICC|nr:TOBE domain-containing protein [Enteractinococcus helveticum]OAV59272.1 MerR family transcriptional regulator [Enteractinococcus helveticum]